MFEKYFDFKSREKAITTLWENSNAFKLGTQNQENFTLVMPPPNANGELHIGHCYGHTIMDIFGRFRRLNGENVLLIPGKDHAGIQTQVVYERKLRSEGIEVEKLTREEFWKSCYDFCIDRSAYMRNQEKLMGISADFDSEVFTLNEKVNEIVYDTFIKMYNDGLIYRGARIVNWSVYSQTSISDVEVEYREEKGNLWHFRYNFVQPQEKIIRKQFHSETLSGELLKNEGNHWILLLNSNSQTDLQIGNTILHKISESDENPTELVIFNLQNLKPNQLKKEDLEKFNEPIRQKIQTHKDLTLIELVPELTDQKGITVATTRPETLLGDTAIAVHPNDIRYTHLIGKTVRVPLQNREIKIIADPRIEIGFGTGAVKITPAHDFLDNQIGLDHNLEVIQVIDKFGKMLPEAGKSFEGLGVLECREKLVQELEKSGELTLVEEIIHKVPISERGKEIIEPLISTQWFLKVDKPELSLKKIALELVKSDQLKVYPARMKDLIIQWLENFNDWNISRQIVWGHRMPVWYKNKNTEQEQIHIGKTPPETSNWEQETDTFDTWFSSGQWPYTTLSSLNLLNPEHPSESNLFPTHTMVMGRDILMFWACRMLLFSAYRFKSLPWKNLYFTGLIRDSKGQKMSKSKGNGVEPKELLEKYGADALRVGLIAGSSAGLDVKFDEKKVDSYSKFLNKIWNAAKLVEMKIGKPETAKLPDFANLKLNSSKWIISEFIENLNSFKQKLLKYEVNAGFDLAYHFSWDIFCSWYLEIAKVELELISDELQKQEIQTVMATVFKGLLQMLHVYMPFITEEIYQNLNSFGESNLLASTKFIQIPNYNKSQAKPGINTINKLQDLISACRGVRRVLEKSFDQQLFFSFDEENLPELELKIAEKIANCKPENVEHGILKPANSGLIRLRATTEEKQLFKNHLKKTLAKKQKELNLLNNMLTEGFKAKADPTLVAEREQQLKETAKEVEIITKEVNLN